MRFSVKESLTEAELQTGLQTIVKDGIASQAMVTLTGGVFLVAVALQLGASNFVIGLLAAIPPLAGLIQLPSVYLVEAIRNRRAICVWTALVGRLFWLVIVFLPFFFPVGQGALFLVFALIGSSVMSAITGCSWNSWMRDMVPQDRLGSFFGRRLMIATGVAAVLSVVAAFFLDAWKQWLPQYEVYGYSLIIFIGFLAGMLGVYYISQIPETPMPAKSSHGFIAMLSLPFKDLNFRRLIVFLGTWNFAVNLAAPFFVVYLLNRLQMNLSLVIVLSILSQLANMMFLRIWGKFSDWFSNKSVLAVCGPLFILCILGWTFTTLPEKHDYTLPLLIILHILMGAAAAGVTLASGNIGLKLAPKDQATAYLASISVINSLAAGCAPILGGLLIDFFSRFELSLELKWRDTSQEFAFQTLNFQNWDFFFFFAFLLGIYSLYRLKFVKEQGEVEEEIVIKELVSTMLGQMQRLTTIEGLRQMMDLPIGLLWKQPQTEIQDPSQDHEDLSQKEGKNEAD